MKNARQELLVALVEALEAAPERERAKLADALKLYVGRNERSVRLAPPMYRYVLQAIAEGSDSVVSI